jgi:hypothetical protein
VISLTDVTVANSEQERPRRIQISGMVVHVRLGLAVAVIGLVLAIAGFVLSVVGVVSWTAFGLVVASAVLAAFGAWTGVWGVIRYGLFTEGCGAQTIADELHLSRFAYWAGVISQLALMFDVAAAVILLVRFAS